MSALEADRDLSESLQRSLLGPPTDLEGADVAARYVPAASRAFIGGDWYDAYAGARPGSVILTIGDMAGHDRQAAAAMSQARNLLRGIALTTEDGPAAALSGLERAMDAVGLDRTATAVLAELGPPETGSGARRLRWSNAGHLPPLVVRLSGQIDLLQRRADRLLRTGTGASARADHEIDVWPGELVVLYTDGLVERRGTSLEVSLRWLRDALEHAPTTTAAATCDALLELIGDDVEDDVALLVVRTS